MKFIPHSQLDKAAWDKLVEKHSLDLFSYSWYLDSCAVDWCVLVDEKWENGIALSFNSNLGIENLTPVIFGRTLDFIGDDVSFQEKALEKIQQRFIIGQLQTEKRFPLAQEKSKVHQVIDTELKLGSQAKRMLKKAEKSGVIIKETNDWEEIIAIAEIELSAKISEFNEVNLKRLRNLTQALSDKKKLICYGIYEGNQLSGGMLFISTPSQNLYLKGSALPDAKKEGGMYLCMHTVIQKTLTENKRFDFGGSSVEGVKRFNYNFGGLDKPYYIYEWNRAPWWYKLSKKLYHCFKKIKN